MAPFIYHSLDPELRQIRVCTLHPGLLNDPLECSLSTVSLNDCPIYESLSYVWGEPIFNKKTIVDGADMMLTTSLHTALRYLRKPNVRRVVWADGICINQSDLAERSSQVSIMGDVYRRAAELQVWLGETGDIYRQAGSGEVDLYDVDDEDLERFEGFLQARKRFSGPSFSICKDHETIDAEFSGALGILDLLSQNLHFHDMPFFSVASTSKLELDPFWYRSLRMLLAILTRPWWTRVWVLQEVVVSPNAKVCIGSHTLDLSTFSSALDNYEKHNSGCCRPWWRLWHGNHGDSLVFYRVEAVLDNLGSNIYMYQNFGSLSPATIFRASGRRNASELHDHVYGLRGLLQDSSILVPDYSLNITQLFAEATMAIFSFDQNLDYLVGASGLHSSNPRKLASWVCDWSQDQEFPEAPWLYDASKGHQHEAISHEKQELTIEVVDIGTVDKVYAISMAELEDAKAIVVKIRQWQKTASASQSTSISTLLRVLSHDRMYNPLRRLSASDMNALLRWWEHIVSELSEPGDGNELQSVHFRFQDAMSQENFAVSRQGLLCSVAHGTRRNDRIFVAKGSKVPLVLRPLYKRSTLSRVRHRLQSNYILDKYMFVGGCYVHGFMDGEAVTADTNWTSINLV